MVVVKNKKMSSQLWLCKKGRFHVQIILLFLSHINTGEAKCGMQTKILIKIKRDGILRIDNLSRRRIGRTLI